MPLTTPREIKLIGQIAERAVKLYIRLDALEERNARFARSGIADEVITVHSEIIPLRLDELLAADDGEFAHDIAGIHRHLKQDRERAYLADGFSPRFGRYDIKS
jgi:hypothetical protein